MRSPTKGLIIVAVLVVSLGLLIMLFGGLTVMAQDNPVEQMGA